MRHRARAILFLIPILILGAPPSLAGVESDRLSDFADATGFHTQKKMARAPDGALYFAYVAPVAGGPVCDDYAGCAPLPTDVVVVRVAPDGRESELPRVKAARGDLSRPSVTLDAAGDLHLAWTERADEDREVFAARFTDGVWVDVAQLSSGDGYAGFPSLGADAAGRVHAAWYGFDGEVYQTFHREWNGTWGPMRQISAGPLDANNPSLVVDATGAVHLAWYKDEGRRYSVWYARRAPAGEWELPVRIPGAGGDALNVALAVDRRGWVHAVWDERSANGSAVVHASRAAGGEWTGARRLATGDLAGEYPALAAWGEGVLVAWADANGTLVGTDLGREPAALLGGVTARNPSLRGFAEAPAGDRAAALDVLWAEPAGDGYRVRRTVVAEGCDPWAHEECPTPNWRKPIPSAGASILALALALAAALALTGAAGARRPRRGARARP